MMLYSVFIYALFIPKIHAWEAVSNNGIYYRYIGKTPIQTYFMSHYQYVNTGLSNSSFDLLQPSRCEGTISTSESKSNKELSIADLCEILNDAKTTSNIYRSEANLLLEHAHTIIRDLPKLPENNTRSKRTDLELGNLAGNIYNYGENVKTKNDVSRLVEFINSISETQKTQTDNSKYFMQKTLSTVSTIFDNIAYISRQHAELNIQLLLDNYEIGDIMQSILHTMQEINYLISLKDYVSKLSTAIQKAQSGKLTKLIASDYELENVTYGHFDNNTDIQFMLDKTRVTSIFRNDLNLAVSMQIPYYKTSDLGDKYEIHAIPYTHHHNQYVLAENIPNHIIISQDREYIKYLYNNDYSITKPTKNDCLFGQIINNTSENCNFKIIRKDDHRQYIILNDYVIISFSQVNITTLCDNSQKTWSLQINQILIIPTCCEYVINDSRHYVETVNSRCMSTESSKFSWIGPFQDTFLDELSKRDFEYENMLDVLSTDYNMQIEQLRKDGTKFTAKELSKHLKDIKLKHIKYHVNHGITIITVLIVIIVTVIFIVIIVKHRKKLKDVTKLSVILAYLIPLETRKRNIEESSLEKLKEDSSLEKNMSFELIP